MIVEALSGEKYANYVQRHIFERYAQVDRARGWPKTFAYFIEEVGELATALSGLEVPPGVVEAVRAAVNSHGSLFIYGAPGNGKTSVANAVGDFMTAAGGEIYVPYAFLAENSIVTVFDQSVHRLADESSGNRVEWAGAAYATYGLRAAFVPMYESQLEKDWAYVVRDSGLKVLFVSSPAVLAKVEPLLRAIPALEHIVPLWEGGASRCPVTYPSLLAAGLAAGASSPTSPARPGADDLPWGTLDVRAPAKPVCEPACKSLTPAAP